MSCSARSATRVVESDRDDQIQHVSEVPRVSACELLHTPEAITSRIGMHIKALGRHLHLQVSIRESPDRRGQHPAPFAVLIEEGTQSLID